MPKKKKNRKMPVWKKWAKAGLGIAGTAIGALVATSPLHRGIRDGLAGSTDQMVLSIRQDTGLGAPGENPNVSRLLGTAVTVGVGIGIIQLFRMIAKRV